MTKCKCYRRKAREDGKSMKRRVMAMKGESAVFKSVIEENSWELRSGQYVHTDPSAVQGSMCTLTLRLE